MLGDNNWWSYDCQYCINFCINFGGCMKLSEQIANSCCGVLADKQRMIQDAQDIETAIEMYENRILELQLELMDLDDVLLEGHANHR